MINKLKQLIKPKYQTLNKIEIKRSAILANYKILQSRQPKAAILPVLKSNAYGHGLKEICQILNDSDAPMVVVDSFPEAQVVYHYFRRKVLILGEMPHKAYSYCDLKRSEFCVYNHESLKALAKLGRAKIHLFINSGMNREGIKDLKTFLTDNRTLLEKVEITGLCSHLASADENSKLNKVQLEKFLENLETLKSFGYKPKWIHLGNSAAIFSISDHHFTAFRSGLALFGYNPFSAGNPNHSQAQKLQPALKLTSTVVSLQKLLPGESVSYNETFVSPNDTTIAVIPFGYYEGLDRGLSNSAYLVWEELGKRNYLKIAGRVCMNLCCLEAGDLNVKIGDKVEIISPNKEDKNCISNFSKISGLTPYELLVRIQSNIRKFIV